MAYPTLGTTGNPIGQLIVVTCTLPDNEVNSSSTAVVGAFLTREEAEQAADDYAADLREEAGEDDVKDDWFTYTELTLTPENTWADGRLM